MKFAIKSIAVAAVSLAVVTGLAACSSSSRSDAPGVSASPEGTFKVGDTEVTTGLPSGWPRDVPTPKGLQLQAGVDIGQGMSANWSGPGNLTAVQAQLDADFKANGFAKEDVLGGGDTGGVTGWKKGSTVVQVITGNESGKVFVNETVAIKQS